MKNVFIETSNVRRFREAMVALEDIEAGQPGLAVVWGVAGRGKTVCAREYAVRTGAAYLRVMQDWTPRAMLGELCRVLIGREGHTVERCRRMATEALDADPRPILVDEADRLRADHIEHFRDIHDLTGAPVVFVGEQHLFAQIESRRRLWSRVTRTVEFGPIGSEDIMLFAMKAAGLRMEPEAAARIAKISSGDFRRVWQAVWELERMCRANRTQTVERAMVDRIPRWLEGPKGTAKYVGRGGK
ncbi:hypothetical protein SAMN02746041_03259 [Desulfacinum hydrothermale DSM 13146]|uniref:ORC1/DEAH AAA+ ATPase domain-containing protein n=1 Tax=Desulfacinum hydrothermale DSM 13146 TaxID=1121390 RepID=A0A1W1XX77_9BACT|nr:AAA family ATPase [Desulfacinum hydrothermale]SMC28472.1 hypothetical protein SAMN02746041_03259 [Desulfacinum hydrothermale DSM 13146]